MAIDGIQPEKKGASPQPDQGSVGVNDLQENSKERDGARRSARAAKARRKSPGSRRSAGRTKATKAGDAAERKLLEARLKELTNVNLRLQAEVQNVTRRALMDVEKAHRFGLVPFVTELLETVDNLEKALASFAEKKRKDNSVYRGVQLTHQSLLNTLRKFNLVIIDPRGETFDPTLHEALGRIESEEHAPNQVVVVMQKGYMLNGRLLRPAKVQIAGDQSKKP